MTLTTRAYRALWRSQLGRALSRELDDAHRALRGMTHAYESARGEADTLLRQFLCAQELVGQRDEQYAALAARCRVAEEERDLWRRYWDKAMPEMEA